MANAYNDGSAAGGSGASESLSVSNSCRDDYTPNAERWNQADHYRLCADMTDFLMLQIDQVGIADAGDLASAIHFVKRESERLAFTKAVNHG